MKNLKLYIKTFFILKQAQYALIKLYEQQALLSSINPADVSYRLLVELQKAQKQNEVIKKSTSATITKLQDLQNNSKIKVPDYLHRRINAIKDVLKEQEQTTQKTEQVLNNLIK